MSKFLIVCIFAFVSLQLVLAEDDEMAIRSQLFEKTDEELKPERVAQLLIVLVEKYSEVEPDDDTPDSELDAMTEVYDLVPMAYIDKENCEYDYFLDSHQLENQYSSNKNLLAYIRHYRELQLALCKKENPNYVPVVTLDEEMDSST